MRTFLVLLFALMAVTASMADICFPNICSYARCVQLREKDCAAKGADWHLIPFAGFCGCCSKVSGRLLLFANFKISFQK